jgi:hypothetical protein
MYPTTGHGEFDFIRRLLPCGYEEVNAVFSGKGLGGSSASNFYTYELPGKEDIDGTHRCKPLYLRHFIYSEF